MRQKIFFSTIFVWIFICVPLICTAKENRTALVIGNASYSNNPLKNTLNDAFDMSEKLEEIGFRVIYAENLTQVEMHRTIEKYFSLLERRKGVGLFYYAGHAVQIDGLNYLVPVDFGTRNSIDRNSIDLEASIKVDKITSGMKKAGCNFNILILDACRNNPFMQEGATLLAKGSRSVRGIHVTPKKGLAGINAPASTFIAYSTAPDKVALDGDGRNGVYTKHLLRYITEKGCSIEDVFKKTSRAVLNETSNQQVPWTNSSITRDFYFNGEPKIKGGKRRVFGAF